VRAGDAVPIVRVTGVDLFTNPNELVDFCSSFGGGFGGKTAYPARSTVFQIAEESSTGFIAASFCCGEQRFHLHAVGLHSASLRHIECHPVV
jgi:hypothetical protein